MKKLGLIIVSVMFAANAAADGVATSATTSAQPNMAIAAAEAGVAMQWDLPDSESTEQNDLTRDKLEQQSRELNEKLEAKLNERLNEKLSRQLQADL